MPKGTKRTRYRHLQKAFVRYQNEEGNYIEISKATDEEQELAGIVLYEENKKVDKALDGLKFHS